MIPLTVRDTYELPNRSATLEKAMNMFTVQMSREYSTEMVRNPAIREEIELHLIQRYLIATQPEDDEE